MIATYPIQLSPAGLTFKDHALAGHGLAFLPQNAVKKELRQGKLMQAGDKGWSLNMDIVLYCKKIVATLGLISYGN